MFKEIQKQTFDKSQINAWTCMLREIWKDDIETITRKLTIQARDKFIWTEGIAEYIELEVSKILN